MSDKIKSPGAGSMLNNSLHKPMALAASGVMGIAFGIAMEKGRVFEPTVIREQMVFSRFIMLKMFLSAVVVGQLGFLGLSILAPKKMQRARDEFAGCVYRRGYLDTAIGGALLGAGMTIAGACPGMVIIQVGSMVPNAVFTIAGLLAGTYVYAALHDTVANLFHHPAHHKKTEVFADQMLGVSAPVLLGGMAVALSLVIGMLEYFFPWTSELPRPNLPGTSGMTMHAWPPMAAGAIIGALQIPAVLFIGDTLGSSTSYVTVCAQPFEDSVTTGMVGYLASYKRGIANWWQVLYISCAVAGAYASSTMGIIPYDVVDPSIAGVPAAAGFIGGVLMIVGSRMAGGCTSGHGLSGMGLLALNSFIAVPAMFAGAMGVAAGMKAYGLM